MLRPSSGPPQPIVDGYGIPFDHNVHLLYVLAAMTSYADRANVPTFHVEPVWKEEPAGRRKCPVLFEDKSCEQFPA